jgi:ABC-type lipoprotein release transport system permease subunit
MLYLLCANLGEQKGRTLTAVAVIGVASAIVMVMASVGQGVIGGALRKAEEAFPRGALLARPKTVNLAMVALQMRGVDDKAVERIRALPGVDLAAPQTSLRMPLRIEGEILGQSAVSDAVVVGIDPAMVAGDVRAPYRFDYDAASSQPIPVVVPKFFLDMYNLAYADTLGMPKVNEDFVIGKTFRLIIGETYLLGGGVNPRSAVLDCRVVGLTANPSLMSGVLIPLGHAAELNRWYTGRAGASYTAVHIKVGDLRRVDEVTSAVSGMGFVVEGNRETIGKFLFLGRVAAGVVTIFGAAVALIAAISIFNTFSLIMRERRGEVGLLRAVGATRCTVFALFVSEVAAVAATGAALGVAASWPLLEWANGAVMTRLPPMSFLPERLFALSGWTALACAVGAVVVCELAALPVIARTVRRAPAALVSEN